MFYGAVLAQLVQLSLHIVIVCIINASQPEFPAVQDCLRRLVLCNAGLFFGKVCGKCV